MAQFLLLVNHLDEGPRHSSIACVNFLLFTQNALQLELRGIFLYPSCLIVSEFVFIDLKKKLFVFSTWETVVAVFQKQSTYISSSMSAFLYGSVFVLVCFYVLVCVLAVVEYVLCLYLCLFMLMCACVFLCVLVCTYACLSMLICACVFLCVLVCSYACLSMLICACLSLLSILTKCQPGV